MTVLAAQAIALPFLGALFGLLLGPWTTRRLAELGLRTAAPVPPVRPTEARGAEAHVEAEPDVPGGDVPAEGLPAPGYAPGGGSRGALGPVLFAVLPTVFAAGLTIVIGLTAWLSPGVRQSTLTTIPTGGPEISVGVSIDGLAALLGVLVGIVALAVQVYSVAYMRDEPRYSSYAAFVSLFTAAMLLVVYASDLLVLYVGWEVMGICSYFLVGHHWEEKTGSRAAVKAFLVTRIGDAGLLLGVIVLGVGAGSFDIATVLAKAGSLPDGTVLAAALLLLCGVAGKSALFPLHTWLPDAMAGPTPISALIHAATMVAAGVYLVARLYEVFLAAPASLAVLGVLAAVSMLGSACAALAQADLKRVLAYSTISQLAVMAAGLAVGAKSAAMFHLVTHGAFKALLFLAAGCVIHAVGSNLLADMGGLAKAMPYTFVSMTIGYLALAGVPPTSGFFSKDAVLEHVQDNALHGGEGIPGWVAWALYLSLLATVALTAAYATRAWLLTFLGPAREAHEAPGAMKWPVVLLAGASAVLGFFALGDEELRPHLAPAAMSLLFTAAGVAAVYLVWRDDPARDPASRLGFLRKPFERAFYVDELYDLTIVRPVRLLAKGVRGLDTHVVDRAVESSVPATRLLGRLARLPQNGNPQTYLTGVLAGAVFLVLAVVALT
ncbi:NADH-quinone oxidoreductase subunit L [Actinocorallia sp. A-T 12471]|uniref:NADH-quinone oxidoreductase subunit 5 family protein n=1 Tax=Actinocorallia sp. A-T 12471 TaxID=3089813 RepID=UPI0029CC23FF|nr:NADH-quinone oxidoreductase subunit L [Actinocorallia sp. A-T 12471]MDX6741695.1 NADH-quinone oxidoreductase subunit L [Actinocorallia sp. A-T 12471]